jgi:Holliday junction resolvase RusA-like endonuclease
MIKLIIPGKPMGKQRPRVMKRGITYTPKETVNYETLVKQLYITQNFEKQLEGPLAMRIIAYFEIPKSTSKKQAAMMRDGDLRPTKKPDMDNIVKIIADALNQLAYKDDSQIVDLIINKFYSEQPRVEIYIREVNP